MSIIVCRTKSLLPDKLAVAKRRAIEINSANEVEQRVVARSPIGRLGGQRRIAVLVGRKWPASGVRLSVSFMDGPSRALRSRILSHMNAWGTKANVVFTETKETGEVRIARLDSPPNMAGYWSYIGTEILDIPHDEPTLNLEGFTMRVSDAEFRRVVRHEAGHTLGFEHEHMRSDLVNRIDRKKAFAYFDQSQGWSEEEVEQQVLTPLAKRSIMGTKESDPLSIMCYQIPGAITKDRKPIIGGRDINPTDIAFAASLYPKLDRRSEMIPATGADLETAALTTGVNRRDENGSDSFQLVVMADTQPKDNAFSIGKPMKPKYAQVLASYAGARVMAMMRLRADKGEKKTRFGKIIRIHERIKAYTNREKGSLPDDEDMIQFGVQLFDTLFQGDVRRLYDEARTRQGRRLELVLTSMIPWIAEKPWEFAYDPGRQSFLATEEVHFIRNVLTNVPSDPIFTSQGPLRILVAAAQPVGFGRLSIDQEMAVIRRGFQPLIEDGLVTIETLARATPGQIHGYLQTGSYQVVHFIGHGVYDEERGEGCLIFINEKGAEYPLGERAVREIFTGRNLSLLFLNACESGRGGRADFNKGVAQSLVARGLPALVANQYSVLDSSATSFAKHFYWSLAQGMSLGQSAREARIAVNYSLHGEPIDWAVPVLYARDASARLCDLPTTRTRAPSRGIRSSARRTTVGHAARIAIWDIDNVFPALELTLEQMNRAQSSFGFELTDLSVPLDVWDLESSEKTLDGTPYLSAEHLADRMQSRPMDLGVDALVCITRHWMRDKDTPNIYAWWPTGGAPQIIIISMAGFDQLSPEGLETDRALANVIVACLAGFYGNLGTHLRGAKDCPLAYNAARDFKSLVEVQKFDSRCRKAALQ